MPKRLSMIILNNKNSLCTIVIVILLHMVLVACLDQSVQNQSAITIPASSSATVEALEALPTQTLASDAAEALAADFVEVPMASPTIPASSSAVEPNPTQTLEADIAEAPATDFVAAPMASPTVDPALFGQGEDYKIYVNYTLDAQASGVQSSLPDGMTQIIIVATVENNSYESLAIRRESLTLVGSQNEHFEADVSDEQLQPSLAGARLKPGESLLGFIKFTLPGEVIPEVIQWCPSNNSNCDRPLTAPIS